MGLISLLLIAKLYFLTKIKLFYGQVVRENNFKYGNLIDFSKYLVNNFKEDYFILKFLYVLSKFILT